MRIGLDLDNTIIAYDHVFAAAARRLGLEASSKSEVRATLQAAGRELDWQRLQGWVYGAGICEARLFDGVREFLVACQGAEVFIVSHKTEFGHFDRERVNLRDAALGWLDSQGLAVPRARIHFGASRAEKLAILSGLACDHFVDDLEEVLRDPAFPPGTSRHLFAPGGAPAGPFLVHRTWHDVRAAILA